MYFLTFLHWFLEEFLYSQKQDSYCEKWWRHKNRASSTLLFPLQANGFYSCLLRWTFYSIFGFLGALNATFDLYSAKIEKEKREHAKQHGMIRTEFSGGEIAEEMEKERRLFQLQMCEVTSLKCFLIF